VWEVCTKFDFELELAFFYGGEGNAMGTRIPIDEAEDHIFGVVLMNDWSARDIQKWEYVPLGPFNGKNFATTVSPWIVTIDALSNFQYELPTQNAKDKTPLPYLQGSNLTNYDLNLSVAIHPEGGEEEQLSTVHGGDSLYWTFSQQLCHHTSTGCPFKPGDLCGSGTISGPESRTEGSMLEISRGGKNPLTLKDGSTRAYLNDGDTLILRGFCQNENGDRIGFGECRGLITPAIV
jgi:fumarylacetoacetase